MFKVLLTAEFTDEPCAVRICRQLRYNNEQFLAFAEHFFTEKEHVGKAFFNNLSLFGECFDPSVVLRFHDLKGIFRIFFFSDLFGQIL